MYLPQTRNMFQVRWGKKSKQKKPNKNKNEIKATNKQPVIFKIGC